MKPTHGRAGAMLRALTIAGSILLASAALSQSLSLSMSAPLTAVAGSALTYTITVTNASAAQATTVTVTDILPPGVLFVSGAGCVTPNGNTVTCSVGTIGANLSAQLLLTVSTPTTLGSITNVAGVVSDQLDLSPQDNWKTASTTLTAVPPPVITSLVPVSGTTSGGDLVAINGSAFAAGATVSIGGVSGTQVTVVSSTQITFRTVSHPPAAVTVLVSTGGGTSNPGGTFTYVSSPTLFFTITPCRVVDTRTANGPLGGPVLAAGQTRTFTVTGVCGIPASARSLSVNYTAVSSSSAGSFTVLPGGDSGSLASSISFHANQTRADNGLIGLSWNGTGTIQVTNSSASSTHLIIDANGYFQ